jgi:hypothetical protein
MVSSSVIPFEAEHSLCRSYPIKEKRDFIHAIDTIIATGVSCRVACSRVGLSHMYYACFKKAIAKVEALEKSDVYLPYKTNGLACKIHLDAPSLLSIIQYNLSQFIVCARHNDVQVSTHMICREAARLLPAFQEKMLLARNTAVGLFVKKMGLSHHAAMHTAQKHFKETQEEASHFIEFMRTKLQGKDPCDIINMDQTPILHSFHSNKTLENRGARTVHVCASTTWCKNWGEEGNKCYSTVNRIH